MKKLSTSLSVFFCLAFLFYSGPSRSYQALLIGITNYQDSPLSNPVNDVRLLSQALSAKGWKTKTIENPRSEALKNEIEKFFQDAGEKSVVPVLIYFSGHGLQYKGENYLLPVNITSTSKVLRDSLSITEIGYSARRYKGPKILIVDACRNSPLGKKTISASSGLNSQYAPPNSLIAYATAPGEFALDGPDGANSPYARSLADALAKGNSLDQVFREARLGTMKRTSGKQLPWESSSLYEDVSFTSSAPLSAPTPTVVNNNPPKKNSDTQDKQDQDPQKIAAQVPQHSPLATISMPENVSYSEALELLKDLMAKAPLDNFYRWDSKQIRAQDRQDFLDSIDLLRDEKQEVYRAFKIIDAYQKGVFYPNCRATNGVGIDPDCGDFDRHFEFVPDLRLSLILSKLADARGIRSDMLANHYARGWVVEKNLVEAYNLYAKDKNRGGSLSHYWWTNINQMVQIELKSLGYDLKDDGDFGPLSCKALSEVIGKTSCARVVSKAQVQRLEKIKSIRFE